MKKAGRHVDRALMRTAVNEKLQTFSHRRLMKDLQEIQQEKIPLVGVTARPSENDLFTWYANVRGPEGTLYAGGVFHLELKFPQSYPHHPPTVKMFTSIPHPNVFGDYICLDMLQQERSEEGGGWSSVYTVQSILMQLQSFLFQENLTMDKNTLEMKIKKAVNDANNFKSPVSKHGGKLSCWPPFNKKETEQKQFQILQDENDLIRKELVCYHTKLHYTQNQMGLGLKISKIPRTGLIKDGETYYDYISLKAFMKESINLTSQNEKITHWMPVYFGQGDNQERFLHCLKKSLSMVMTNSTKNFKTDFIIEVFPKLIITLAFHIMDEKKHPSIRIIRILTHIHSMFLYCVNKFPEVKSKITAILNDFKKDQASRVKDKVPNLGCILAMISVTDDFKFADIANEYFMEQLDRQVFWILKSVPELVSSSLEESADKVRSKLVFKSQMTSFHILCFYKLFITSICEKRENKTSFLKQYEGNLCKLTNKEENFFQNQIKNISKNIQSFDDYFAFIGLKPKSDQQVNKMLKNAIKNSEDKNYHNKFQVMQWNEILSNERKKSQPKVQTAVAKLPSSQEQFKKLYENIPAYKKFINVKSVNEQGKHKFEYSEEPSMDKDWRQMCIRRWAWIKQAILSNPKLSAKQISFKAIETLKKGVSQAEDRVVTIMNKKYKESHTRYQEPTIEIPDIDWKRLFLRLDLQDFLKYIDMNPDFATFYEKLHVCSQNNINTIVIPIVQVNNLKSGYHYITSLLSQLTTLKYIQFSGLKQMNNRMNDKAAKAIKKGLSNFHDSKGQFDIISFYNIMVTADFSEHLFTYLSKTENLRSLRFDHTNILSYGNAMKVLSGLLIQLKTLEELTFTKCSLDSEKCKILADSLMRMKKLKIFRMTTQKGLGMGLASIIYNLSFNPNLIVLDLKDITIAPNEVNQTMISLYKMLKISASVQILYLRKITGLNPALTREFWNALGQCRSLKVLDISQSGDLSAKANDLGMAIAFNAKRKGVLQFLNIIGTINNATTIDSLYKGMKISEYDEEQWYGDPNKLAKMIATNYKKHFYNNLKALQLNYCTNLNPNFSLINYNKLVNKTEPDFVKLLADSPQLTTLQIRSAGLKKNMADILVLALDDRRNGLKCQLKVIDLSKNLLQKDGLKQLAQVLSHNGVLEVLDLSRNKMGVSGAAELAKSLKDNKSLRYLNVFNNKIGYDGAKAIAENIVANHPMLEFLELGHNRIRDKGLDAIIDALIENKHSNLRILGLRFNFITNTGILENFTKLFGAKTLLQEIFTRNNLISDETIYKLRDLHEDAKSSLSIDILQKVKFLDPERTDRSIWVHPMSQLNIGQLKKFFEIQYKCGIIMDFRIRVGRKYPNRKGENKFCIIEFADPASVTEALSLAARKLTCVGGKKFRVFKAGTGTFVFSKKTAKQKKLQQAKNNLPKLPFPVGLNPVVFQQQQMAQKIAQPTIAQNYIVPQQVNYSDPFGGASMRNVFGQERW